MEIANKQTILVTGGAGYIGSVISLLLAQQGYKVIIIDDLRHGQSTNHITWAMVIKGDFADESLLADIFKNYTVQAVVHCAALAEVGISVVEPYKFYDNNVAKTIKLLTIMQAHGVNQIIFSSSCSVYGIPNERKTPLHEAHPKAPLSPYAHTKLMVETILADAAQAYGLQYVVLRYFNAAGAVPEHGLGEHHVPETHLIPLVIYAAQQQKPINIFGGDYPTKDGTCVRDYLHVLDIAQAHLCALKHLEDGRSSDVFNLGTGRGYSVKEIIEAVEQVSGMPIKSIVRPRRAGDSPELIADPSRAHSLLGWQPKFSDLNFIIRSAYAYAYAKSSITMLLPELSEAV